MLLLIQIIKLIYFFWYMKLLTFYIINFKGIFFTSVPDPLTVSMADILKANTVECFLFSLLVFLTWDKGKIL